MFGLRSDGKKVKSLNPIFRVITHIMKERADSQVYYSQDLPIKYLDEYIEKKEQEGIKLSYMSVIYAGLVRLLAEKPVLNRFIMDGRTYQRNEIILSLVIKKGLSEDAEETVLKIHFTGRENVFEIQEKLQKAIAENKDKNAKNNIDSLAKVLSKVPDWLMKFFINLFTFLDKHGVLPRAIIDASPFHSSAFLTNVGSIGIDAIYHHIYNFGTVSVFLAMGKKKKRYVYEDDDIIAEKAISLKWVADERICDGFYYASALKAFYRYMKKPELLENNFDINSNK